MIAGSFHKTGTVLIRAVFAAYNRALPRARRVRVRFETHFDRVPRDDALALPCVVMIRHPMERVCSGVRYHATTTERWANLPQHALGGATYREKTNELLKVSSSAAVAFEMRNSAANTIRAMRDSVLRYGGHENVVFVQLEALYSARGIARSCARICAAVPRLDRGRLRRAMRAALRVPYHRTHPINEHTFPRLFRPEHYALFEALFPADTLRVLGYPDVTARATSRDDNARIRNAHAARRETFGARAAVRGALHKARAVEKRIDEVDRVPPSAAARVRAARAARRIAADAGAHLPASRDAQRRVRAASHLRC